MAASSPASVTMRLSAADWQALRCARQHAIAQGKYRVAQRLRMVQLAAKGQSVAAIAQRTGRTPQTVQKYLLAYYRGGIAALGDRPRTGRPRTVHLTDAHLLELAGLQASGERWTLRRQQQWLAAQYGITVSISYLSWHWRRRSSALDGEGNYPSRGER